MAKRKIVANQTFLDGADRFEAGESYFVDEPRALYFARNGWIDGVAGVPSPQDVTLDIESSSHGHDAEEA